MSAPAPIPAATLPVIVAIVLLNTAVWLTNGLFSPLAVATVALALALFGHALVIRGAVPETVFAGFAVVGVAVQGGLLLACPPLNDVMFTSVVSAWPHYAAWSAVIVLAMSLAFVRLRFVPWVFLLLAVCVVLAGVWTIQTNMTPRVDVFYFQRDASTALLRGQNPYRLTFPNPYSPAESWVYAPGAAADGRLLFGFPYMPTTLLAVAPAQWVLGDFRYAHLAWVVVPATLVVLALGTRTSALAMALLLTAPRLPWVIEWGWTEPVLVGSLLLTALAAHRSSSLTALPLALFLSAKQYMALFAPLALLLPRRSTSKFLLLTFASGSLLTLPLVLWDFPAFWSSAVALQFRQPFRPDALSLPALVFHLTGHRLPELLSLVAAAGLALALTLLGRTPFPLALALAVPVLFFLSKQAFANYYFLTAAIWCTTLAFPMRQKVPPTPPESLL